MKISILVPPYEPVANLTTTAPARQLVRADELAAAIQGTLSIEVPIISLRLGPRDELARRSAEPLASVAGPAHAEHELALRTALEAKLLVVHRLLAR